MRLDLNLRDTKDTYLRDNLLAIKKYVDAQPLLQGEWKFFEIEIARAVTGLDFRHGLGFAPTDVIQTSIIGVGALTWNYTNFDSSFLNITTTGACTVRVFVGRYEKAG